LKRLKYGFDVKSSSWIKNGLGRGIRAHLKDNEAAWRAFSAFPVDVDTRFSDRRLLQSSVVMSEAIALLWLCDVASQR
jgi:hypothetical protein